MAACVCRNVKAAGVRAQGAVPAWARRSRSHMWRLRAERAEEDWGSLSKRQAAQAAARYGNNQQEKIYFPNP